MFTVDQIYYVDIRRIVVYPEKEWSLPDNKWTRVFCWVLVILAIVFIVSMVYV